MMKTEARAIATSAAHCRDPYTFYAAPLTLGIKRNQGIHFTAVTRGTSHQDALLSLPLVKLDQKMCATKTNFKENCQF